MHIKNFASTTLSGAATNVDTSLSVTSGAVFPAAPFTVVLNNLEVVLCTAISSNTLTVVRGQESTTAIAHASGVSAISGLTTGVLMAVLGEYEYGNNAYPLSPITIGSWTAHNSVTASQAGQGILITGDGTTGDNFRYLLKSISGTVFTIKMTHAGNLMRQYIFPVIGLKESATNKLIVLGPLLSNTDVTLAILTYTSDASGASFVARYNYVFSDVYFLRISIVSTNLVFAYSIDGTTYYNLTTVAITGAFTTAADQIFFGLNCTYSTTTPLAQCLFLGYNES